MKKVIVICIGLLATLYICNPTAGLFEIIPDNLPLVGNLDEAAAIALLLMCLSYFGVELPDIFKRNKDEEKTINLDKS